MSRVAERMQPDEVPYEPWYEAYRPTPDILDAQRSKVWEHSLKFSIIVPAFHTPEDFLCQMLESVQAQTYSNWELCIANASSEDTAMRRILENYSLADSRIRFANLSQNTGISQNTNAALAIATGDFVCLLDHDDLLAPNALYEAALALERNPEIDVMYTDEDKVTTDLSKHFQPHLKPDYSPIFFVPIIISATSFWSELRLPEPFMAFARNLTEHRIMILFSAALSRHA